MSMCSLFGGTLRVKKYIFNIHQEMESFLKRIVPRNWGFEYLTPSKCGILVGVRTFSWLLLRRKGNEFGLKTIRFGGPVACAKQKAKGN